MGYLKHRQKELTMNVKYILAKEEGMINGKMKYRPVLEFDSYNEAKKAQMKVKSGSYSVVPMIVE